MTKSQQKTSDLGPDKQQDDEWPEEYTIEPVEPKQTKQKNEASEQIAEEEERESKHFISLKLFEELETLFSLGESITFLYLFLKKEAGIYSGRFGSRRARPKIWSYASISEAIQIKKRQGKAKGEPVGRQQIREWLGTLEEAGLVVDLKFEDGLKVGSGVTCLLPYAININPNAKKTSSRPTQKQEQKNRQTSPNPAPRKRNGGVVL